MTTIAEENYLKAIIKAGGLADQPVSTNSLAAALQTAAASVTDMLKRLADKNLIVYEKYKGVRLTVEGRKRATALVRKHRLWEVFLVEKLGFSWDEVHDFAEQLEHVQGDALINRLDVFLNHPRIDPHGDPIPDADGRWVLPQHRMLAELPTGSSGNITGVQDHSALFLQYLAQAGLTLGVSLEVMDRNPYDQSVWVRIGGSAETLLSEKVARNLLITISQK